MDGVKQTQPTTGGVVEVILPLSEGLETVHHTSVVTVGGGSDETEDVESGLYESWEQPRELTGGQSTR